MRCCTEFTAQGRRTQAIVLVLLSLSPCRFTAGSGDVLTGVMTALMGQGLSNFDAAVLGVYIHGLAGDIAAEKTGQVSLMATDIIESLPEAFLKNK